MSIKINDGYDSSLRRLFDEFPNHHVELSLFPSGGLIDVTECEECGSHESFTKRFYWGGNRTPQGVDSAIVEIKKKIESAKEVKS